MTEDAALSQSEREALELLPWYVNGTLADDERERVHRELRSSLTCRLEYERLNRMQALMRSDDAEHAATDRAFERLMARVQASDAAPQAPAAANRRVPRGLWLAQAAAVLAVVSGAAWWWNEDAATERGSFVTLTAEQPEQAQAGRLRLLFATGVAEETRRAIFAELGLRAVAPPSADGIYTLVLPDNADARAIASRLRADPRIAFVTTPPGTDRP
jgi:hypothetical protein